MPQDSASFAVQKYIRTTLDTALGSTPIRDYVLETDALPYVTIGIDSANDWSTKTGNGQEITAVVEAWSEYYGRKEAKEIIDAAMNALGATPEPSLTADGFTCVYHRARESSVELEEYMAGRLVYHGRLTMRYLVEQV